MKPLFPLLWYAVSAGLFLVVALDGDSDLFTPALLAVIAGILAEMTAKS